MARRYDSRTTIFSPEGRLYQVEYALESISHAGTIVGILAPGPSSVSAEAEAEAAAAASAPSLTPGNTDVEMSTVTGGSEPPKATTSATTSTSTPSSSTSATATPALSKKEQEAIEEREKKYPRAQARPGIVLAAEKKVTSKLLEKDIGSSEKIFRINSNTLAAAAGFTSDANSLVSYARNTAQNHLLSYNTPMPVEQLVQTLCNLKQGYTQYGGLRPFGVTFLFAGHDPHHNLQLYATDPSGNYAGWKAFCAGANAGSAQSLVRQDYRDDIGLDEAMGLALKVLSKTMDSTSLDSEKLEFATLTLGSDGEPVLRVFKPDEIDVLLEKEGLSKKPEDETA